MIGSRDDRRHTRYDASGEVHLRIIMAHAPEVRQVRARLRNAGRGGLYAETPEEIPPGVLADLDVRIDGTEPASALGLVRWSKPGDGVGIEFFHATDEERRHVESRIDAWLARRSARGGQS